MIHIYLLDIVMKAAVLLAAAGIVTLGMRKAAAASRHLVWCCAASAVLCLPLLSAVLPAWHVLPQHAQTRAEPLAAHMEQAGLSALHDAPPPAPPLRSTGVHRRASRSVRAADVVIAVWVAGTIVGVLPVLMGWWRLRRQAGCCDPVTDATPLRLVAQASSDLGLSRPIVLLTRDGPVMPMTWGVLRPTVLLPRESFAWPRDRLRAVMLHELAHVKRLDCLTHLIAKAARAVYWFNPLAWAAVWRMGIERERACDDLVLRAGMRQSDYARELLAVGTSLPPAPRGLAAMAMARPSRPSRMERRLRDEIGRAHV